MGLSTQCTCLLSSTKYCFQFYIFSLVCGGKNDIPGDSQVIKKCLEYQIGQNQWKEIASMKQPRFRAASTLDKDGFLWVLGGTHDNSSNLLTTEVYFPNQKLWRNGYAMPPALRDTGIVSQCTVRYV